MEDLKRELADGSELIWSIVGSRIHRWRPDKAILMDEYDDEVLPCSDYPPTRVFLYLAENGSLVLKRLEMISGEQREEYWVYPPRSQDAVWSLLRRERAGALDKRGKELLEEYGQALDLA